MKIDPIDFKRRKFLLSAGVGGAVPSPLSPPAARCCRLVHPKKLATTPRAGSGYQTTEHVRNYYARPAFNRETPMLIKKSSASSVRGGRLAHAHANFAALLPKAMDRRSFLKRSGIGAAPAPQFQHSPASCPLP